MGLVNFHLVLNYPLAQCVVLEPEETQEVSMLWINVKGVKHLFNVTYDGFCLPPKSK